MGASSIYSTYISFEFYIVHQVNINLMNHALLKWTGNNYLLVFIMLLVIS